MDLPVLKFISVLPQIAVWSVSKITFASGKLVIYGRCEDLNNFRELLWALIMIECNFSISSGKQKINLDF